jgi:FKBP-type peptidyl-prolyl cis-trans isomerase
MTKDVKAEAPKVEAPKIETAPAAPSQAEFDAKVAAAVAEALAKAEAERVAAEQARLAKEAEEKEAENARLRAEQDAKAEAERLALEEAQKNLPAGWVRYRVLKKGDGKIATGEHALVEKEVEGSLVTVPEFTHYRFGDIVAAPRRIAEALEARDFVEIQP